MSISHSLPTRDSCDEFIDQISRQLPDLCSTKDLIEIGIFTSEQMASLARSNNQGPEYFKMPRRRIVYPKNGVLAFLRKNKRGLTQI